MFNIVYIFVWQHDSACRVIARLKKELDEAMMMLAHLERQAPVSASTAMTANAPALSNGRRRNLFYVFLNVAIC